MFYIQTSKCKIGMQNDQSAREIDFVVRGSGGRVHAIECKINPDQFTGKSLAAFRAVYPQGKNVVISPGIKQSYSRRIDGFVIRFQSLAGLIPDIEKMED